MIKVSLKWIAEAVQGELVPENSQNVTVESVTIDSRQIRSGDLFIAIKGPNFDGHTFAEQAEAEGAAALIVESQQNLSIPQIIVADTRHALGQLAGAVKDEVAPKTIAVTGSSGKTTVKEMLASILREQGEVLATQGNFNNDIGVPLTLLRIEPQHQYAVIELGANHRGEIAYTTGLTKPDVAMINNVSPAHVEGFGDICGIARAKTEIFRGLGDTGTAVTSADSEFHEFWMRELADKRHQLFSSQHKEADVWAEDVSVDSHGCAQFTLCTPHQREAVRLNIPGKHNVNNALAAATCCFALGIPIAQVVRGLGGLSPVPGRMWVHEPKVGLRIIDDAYNANVGSVRAALDVLSTLPGKRIFVLGDMGELGENARGYHEEVGEYAIHSGIDALFTLGVLSQSASEVFNGRGGKHFEHKEELIAALHQQIAEHSELTILVKGSRSAHMESVVEALLESYAPSQNNKNSRGKEAC
ncbi:MULTISPECIES: UDP-N-acetylmuramoyl-tripeptide--D-alanyl-D-alanine ligase [Gammaproteobacteria]|uniref:UDP-N-acetylmuramoyl-tripeptide--D-alanyl-D- alanine ligase n=1 Tax=Gammaproteobacteria TaxID=1236 RepID=UPI000DD0127D|nr:MULTISPECIES: UDP-N-acetylmuramoyl-tripeptide--D-alanyl-D-alanine ligase [Gammaproteobacteria]RTE86321.1 UDP-N-acetylmuramoyl-tripeptide--D-alanyl-D-alanine ligase [Aliidiomarina sp. B3213]TCZ91671.1 UDP-N-acetylmuramoyl-tripeptide--D-alanyl-D-alanine ligase [Lysobacter sp. N42]